MDKIYIISFAKSKISTQDYKNEITQAINFARLNLEYRYGISLKDMSFSYNVCVTFKDPNDILNSHHLRGISRYLLKKYPDKFKPLLNGTRLFYYTEVATGNSKKKTVVVIPNESLPEKCSKCFAFNEEGGCNLYSLGIPGRFLIGELDSRPEWCELEEKEDEE